MVALLLFRDNPCSGCKGPGEAPEFAESSQFGTPMCHQFLILMCLQFLLYTLCRSYRDQLEIACRLSCPGSVPSFNARRLRRLRRLRRRQVLLQRNHRGKQLGRPTAVSGVRPQDAVPYDCTTRLVDSCWHPCRFNGYIGYIRISLAVSRSLDLEWPGYHWIILIHTGSTWRFSQIFSTFVQFVPQFVHFRLRHSILSECISAFRVSGVRVPQHVGPVGTS